MTDAVTRARPGVLKTLDLNRNGLLSYKTAHPDGMVLYRCYTPDETLTDPEAHADRLFDQIEQNLKSSNCLDLVDVLEGYNETGLWNDAPNYCAFTIRAAARAHAIGKKYCAYDFSEANPDPSLWHVYAPGLAASDFLGLHEYSAPSMDAGAGTRCLRYRTVYSSLPPDARKPIVITECGIDGGTIGQGGKGWKDFGDAQHYLQSLSWYASEIAKDDYLVGATIFCCGTADPRWNPFDIKDTPEILDFIARLDTQEIAMSYYPKAVWKGSPDFGYPTGTHGRNGVRPQVIVNHIAQGSEVALDSEFASPSANASSSLGSNRDGTAHAYVSDEDAPYTNGIAFEKGYDAYKSDLSVPFIKWCWDTRTSPNLGSLTIEHEGESGQPLTEEQYQTTLSIHKYWILKYGIPIDRDHILGHYQFDSITRAECPGPAFPWDRLMADLTAWHKEANMGYLGAPHGGPTVYRPGYTEQIGSYSIVLIYTFANGALWASPDDGYAVHAGLPAAMTDDQVRRYGKDIWQRGQAALVDGQSIPEEWLKGLLALRQ